MNIPKKINPDNLRDTVIEFRYEAGIAPELVLGCVHCILKDDYKFASLPESPKIDIPAGKGVELSFGLGMGFFVGKEIKLQVTPNVIAFNCINQYLGWSVYSATIYDVLNRLLDGGIIKSFNRINVRYISEFPEVDILKSIKGKVELTETGACGGAMTLRIEKESEVERCFITLSNNVKRKNDEGTASLFDVSVFRSFDGNDIDSLKKQIEGAHMKQKELFFSFLSDNFLHTLNPEY